MRFGFLLAFILMLSAPAFAQKAPAAVAAPPAAVEGATRLPDRIIRPMRAIDAMTLRAEGVTIRLWGIKPAQTNESPLELQGLDLMDKLIQEQQVNCKIMGGVMPDLVGRCVTQENQDLALQLLSEGFAVVDRLQTYDSVFATAYEKAQEAGRLNRRGVWSLISKNEQKSYMPEWLEPYMSVILPFALIFGPLLGLLIIAGLTHRGLRAISEAHAREFEQEHLKETALEARERQVLVTTMEGELVENKNKIEAFLVIYNDTLRTLKDTSETPKYQQVGDIIQKHPSFNKTVFEASVNRLSLLNVTLAGHISKLYSSLPKEAEYINLDPNVPLDTAIMLVEKVMKDASDILPQIEAVIAELQKTPIR
jgi:endonuclease YncB( thermonuclease family)